MANNVLAMAMPLVSFPVMELLKYTINKSTVVTPARKKQLIGTIEKINVAPGASHMSVQKDDVVVEIYMDFDDATFDINKNLKEVCAGLEPKTIEQIVNQAANLILFVNMYFEAIKDRVPDVFKKLKDELKLENQDAFDGIFIDTDRKMYFDSTGSKRIMPKFKRTTKAAKEKDDKSKVNN